MVRICHLICFIQSVTISFPNLNMRPYSRLNPKKVREQFPDLTSYLFTLYDFFICPCLNSWLLSLDRLTSLFVSLSVFLNSCLTLPCTFFLVHIDLARFAFLFCLHIHVTINMVNSQPYACY